MAQLQPTSARNRDIDFASLSTQRWVSDGRGDAGTRGRGDGVTARVARSEGGRERGRVGREAGRRVWHGGAESGGRGDGGAGGRGEGETRGRGDGGTGGRGEGVTRGWGDAGMG